MEVISLKRIEAYDGTNESIAVLRQVSQAEGTQIGSINIDEDCTNRVEKRLDMVRRDDPGVLLNPHAAQNVVQRDFQNAKSAFGTTLRQPLADNLIVPDLPSNFCHSAARIKNGRIEFNK
jgi:hypothetical protein